MISKILVFIIHYFVFIIVKILPIFRYFISKKRKTILYFENFPEENAGYQYRSLKWVQLLNNEKIYKCEIKTLNNTKKEFDDLYKNFNRFIIKSLFLRIAHIVYSCKFEIVIVRREILLFNEYGNLFMEKCLLKIHPNAILDFDDDIAASKKEPRSITSLYGKLLYENGNKFTESLKIYNRFIVASKYLETYILSINNHVSNNSILIMPTCVDYDKYEQKIYNLNSENIVFGWIGGDYNYVLLDFVIPILNKLADIYKFKLIVIGGKEYKRDVNFKIEFIPWKLNTEIENLNKIDVGLMPLLNDKVSKGKGGFKLIQYMGLGIVSIASPVTINKEIVDDGINSFLASDSDSWEDILLKILNKDYDLQNIGVNARKKITEKYTFESNKNSYINFLQQNLI